MVVGMALRNRWAAALAGMVGLAVLLLLPAVAGAQQAPQLMRSVAGAGVNPGQTITITITPSGFTGFYAVEEQLGGLELVVHTADNYEDGTFVMLGAQPLTYDVRVPETAKAEDQFSITGQWWTDPGDKMTVAPAAMVLSLGGASMTAGAAMAVSAEKGDKGDSGATGPAGVAGAAGIKGKIGEAGNSGPAGIAGSTGSAGPAGPAGPSGAQGVAGEGGGSSLRDIIALILAIVAVIGAGGAFIRARRPA